jgi:hypothetical protein
MNWPTQTEVLAGGSIYGNPRGKNGLANVTWERQNLVYVKAPFIMRFAGQPLSKGMKIHVACSASLARVMQAIWSAAGQKQSVIDKWGVSIYGGGHNFRLMRGGNSLSMHSYGCAIDLDPARNGFHDRTPNFANVPEVRKAFADEGWRWGGDWNGNGSSADERQADGMHWQATR